MYEIQIDWTDCLHFLPSKLAYDEEEKQIIERHFERRRQLFLCEEECCCTVVFAGTKHKYNAAFLCEVSEWFKAALTNPEFRSCQSKRVVLEDTDPAIFASLMDLACHSPIQSTEIPFHLFYVADQLLMVPEVLEALERAAFESVTIDNCCEWMNYLADVTLLSGVFDKAYNTAVRHFEHVNLNALALPTLEKLFDDDRLAVRDEDVVLQRASALQQELLLQHIRWGVLRPSKQRSYLEATYGGNPKAFRRRIGMDVSRGTFHRGLAFKADNPLVQKNHVTAMCAGWTSVFLGFEDGKVLAHTDVREKALETPMDVGHVTCMVYMEQGDVVFCGYNSGLLVVVPMKTLWKKLDDEWKSHIAVWRDHRIIYCTDNYKVYEEGVGNTVLAAAAVETKCVALVVWGDYLFTMHRGSSIIYVYDLNAREPITQLTPKSNRMASDGERPEGGDLLACDRRLLAVNTKLEITVWMLGSWEQVQLVSIDVFRGINVDMMRLTISGSKLICVSSSGYDSKLYQLDLQTLDREDNIALPWGDRFYSFITVPGGNVWCIFGAEHYVGTWGDCTAPSG